MDRIKLNGKIVFEPPNITTKHHNQSSWKKVAFVEFDGDICEYYAWFIQRRYNIIFNKPLRKPHVSFINDSIKDLRLNDTRTIGEVEILWNIIKQKWNGKEIEVVFSLDTRSDNYHWWLNIPHEERELLHGIRTELGLGKPYWGLHMSIGYPHPKHEEHSKYIVEGIKNGFITT
jgi:hypothetical protein